MTSGGRNSSSFTEPSPKSKTSDERKKSRSKPIEVEQEGFLPAGTFHKNLKLTYESLPEP